MLHETRTEERIAKRKGRERGKEKVWKSLLLYWRAFCGKAREGEKRTGRVKSATSHPALFLFFLKVSKGMAKEL